MGEKIEQELKVMLIERLFLKFRPEEIEDNKNLMENYGLDSVSVMEMVVGLEELYGITFEPGEFKLEYFQTIRGMAAFVRAKLAS